MTLNTMACAASAVAAHGSNKVWGLEQPAEDKTRPARRAERARRRASGEALTSLLSAYSLTLAEVTNIFGEQRTNTNIVRRCRRTNTNTLLKECSLFATVFA
jgi:hypothetical protein